MFLIKNNKWCNMTEENVKIFEENEIRVQYEETTQKYYYSIVDVISSITDTKNPRRYWSGIKSKIKIENNQFILTRI